MTGWTTIEILPGDEPVATLVFALRGVEAPVAPARHRARAADAIACAGFDCEPGRWLDVLRDGGAASRLVVVGLDGGAGAPDWETCGRDVVEALAALRIPAARLPSSHDLGGGGALARLLEGALSAGFRHAQRRKVPVPDSRPARLLVDPADAAVADTVNREAVPTLRARAWVEQPANVLTPGAFAREASEALTARGVATRVLGRAELEALGAGAIVAVAGASHEEPRLLVAEWRGDPSRAGWDVALVGKGLTFDAGGLNVKSAPVIEKMRLDMAGGAAVIGALELAALRGAPVNAVAVVPMLENLVGGGGYRPGDVITSLSGRTIEVVNTDAEGRLVLADGMTYAVQHYDPACLVDVATLTGMIAAVLHEEYAGLYASDERLAAQLLGAAGRSGEGLWRMPLGARLDYLVASKVADLANFGALGHFSNAGGSPTAGAQFLAHFAEGRPWAHLDISGPAWCHHASRRSRPGATGFGVRCLAAWLSDLGSAGGRLA
jgi:leucyl aminopeptidase